MLRRLSPAGALIILCLITMLTSCNEQLDNGGGTNGGPVFDTVRASRQVIPIQEAITLQRGFIDTRSAISKRLSDTFLLKNFNLPNSESFTRDAILLLLSQKGADGIRFYYGKDAKGEVRLVLLPIDSNGKDIYTKLITTSARKRTTDSAAAPANARAADVETESDAVETGQTCPPCLITPQN